MKQWKRTSLSSPKSYINAKNQKLSKSENELKSLPFFSSLFFFKLPDLSSFKLSCSTSNCFCMSKVEIHERICEYICTQTCLSDHEHSHVCDVFIFTFTHKNIYLPGIVIKIHFYDSNIILLLFVKSFVCFRLQSTAVQ